MVALGVDGGKVDQLALRIRRSPGVSFFGKLNNGSRGIRHRATTTILR